MVKIPDSLVKVSHVELYEFWNGPNTQTSNGWSREQWGGSTNKWMFWDLAHWVKGTVIWLFDHPIRQECPYHLLKVKYFIKCVLMYFSNTSLLDQPVWVTQPSALVLAPSNKFLVNLAPEKTKNKGMTLPTPFSQSIKVVVFPLPDVTAWDLD